MTSIAVRAQYSFASARWCAVTDADRLAMPLSAPCAHVVNLNRHQRQFFLDHLVIPMGLPKAIRWLA